MNRQRSAEQTRASLLLGGGIGLGAYQVGAFEVLQASDLDFRSVSGSSIGAINGAIIVGNAPADRGDKLRSFWKAIAVEALPSAWLDPWGFTDRGRSRRIRNWVNSLTTGMSGSPRLFVPRHAGNGRGEARSLYDNSVAADTLKAHVDFGRLNSGPIRFCLAATDVDAGEPVFFDTAKGDRIEVEHLLASSSLLPAFEPTRIGDRLLADGGLSCNVPLEAEIGYAREGAAEPLCFLLDLYTAGGGQPMPLNQVVESSIDLIFGTQTRVRLAGLVREWKLMSQLRHATRHPAAADKEQQGVDLFFMSYQGAPEDAGFGKPMDLSPATIAERMMEGRRAAENALALRSTISRGPHEELRVHAVRGA
jgi:NTE family protein